MDLRKASDDLALYDCINPHLNYQGNIKHPL